MNAVLATSTAVPLLSGPSLRHEMVTQLILGEAALVLSREGDMLQVRTYLDDYPGWLHRGYVRETDRHTAESWLATAGWSEGAVVECAGVSRVVPHRGRLAREGDNRVRLPDGQSARVLHGAIRAYGDVIADAMAVSPGEWAWQQFAGTPYLWGGVTAAGMDCSGLVQTTFLARGIPLPRDAQQQAAHGTTITADAIRAGDLIFFRGTDSDAISHVAIAVDGETIVHSTVEVGGVIREPWSAGSRAAGLRDLLAAVRRVA